MAPPILKLDDIFLSIGGTPLLAGASLQVEPGDRISLVGRNVKGDPKTPYDGSQKLHQLICGGGKGC